MVFSFPLGSRKRGSPLTIPLCWYRRVEWHFNKATNQPTIKFHWRCKKIFITNICFSFTNDLMLFCYDDKALVEIRKTYQTPLRSFWPHHKQYQKVLFTSLKLMCNFKNPPQTIGFQYIGFQYKSLPMKYLGVPLIITKLTHTDCFLLMDRIFFRVKLQTSTSLTYT